MNENPKIILLTGPAGAGKNTVAATYSRTRERCAVVDVDAVRQMLTNPHKAPWEGKDGALQYDLGIRNACALVRNFFSDGCDVLILDVVPEERISLYKEELADLGLEIILLLPSFQEIQRRNASRTVYLKNEEIEMLYRSQEKLISFDRKIDTTKLSPDQVVEELLS